MTMQWVNHLESVIKQNTKIHRNNYTKLYLTMSSFISLNKLSTDNSYSPHIVNSHHKSS